MTSTILVFEEIVNLQEGPTGGGQTFMLPTSFYAGEAYELKPNLVTHLREKSPKKDTLSC